MRAFLAVPPDPAWTARAGECLARLRPSLPSASWTRPETWHLTLRFFANIAREAAEKCAEETFRAAELSLGGELVTGGSLVFPERGRARVLGVGLAHSPVPAALEAAAAAAEAAARRAGAPPEDRRYHPHVTFARIRTPWPPAAVERFRKDVDAWELPPFRLAALVLYESRLGSGGATHTALRTATLPGQEVRA